MRKEDLRENELTEQSSGSYRGNDTYVEIPIVDVVHSVNLLARTVSDHKQRRKI